MYNHACKAHYTTINTEVHLLQKKNETVYKKKKKANSKSMFTRLECFSFKNMLPLVYNFLKKGEIHSFTFAEYVTSYLWYIW